MVFSFENEIKKNVAAIQNGDIIERYECSLHVCENPVCTCGIVQLRLSPLGHEDQNNQISPYKVVIDIKNKKLDYKYEDKIPKESLKFANLLISNMDDADFYFLWEGYFAYKNKMTEEATTDSIEAHFDYQEVEKNGLMSAYNDVLPYGDQLSVSINGENCIIFDQYCLLPMCACTEAHINVFLAGEYDNPGEELYFVTLDYRKKKWGMLEGRTKSVDTKTVRSAIEEQIPDIYNRFLNRHNKLKGIYSHCKNKYFAHAQQTHLPKAGRNDPCPCGSGKKYKNCCLSKSN